MSSSFGYEKKSVAESYTKYRPQYPEVVSQTILGYLDENGLDKIRRRELAVDVGCGSGQSTLTLSPHFNRVVGIDNSKAQLTEARKLIRNDANIEYKPGSSDDVCSLFEEESVDLVSVGTALHWFDVETFYRNCWKILKPGGAFVAYTYILPSFSEPETEALVLQLLKETFKNYWQPESRHPWNGYEELYAALVKSCLFNDCHKDDSMGIELNYSIDNLCGFVESFPQYNYYMEKNPGAADPLVEMKQKLMLIYGVHSTGDKVIRGYIPMTMILGRKRLSN